MRFPNFPQLDSRDCGPTCLQIICKYFGKYISIEKIRKLMNTGKDGSSIYDFIEAASALEINCLPYSISYWKFRHEVQLPCVVLWNRNHFIVVYKITKKYIFVSDPAFGLCKYTLAEFAHGWLSYDTNESKTKRGICITCEPTIRFSDIINDKQSNGTLAAIQFVWAYMKQYKKQVIQIISILLLITSLSATFPLFTQSIIDTGIPNQDRNFILLMLIAYISLSIGKAIGTWLHSSVGMKFAARMKVSMISDYIIRLFQMPLNFFENRLMGDIIQRNADFDRIESMTINSFFASILGLFSLLIFGTILFVYQETLFWVFLAGGTLYVLWVLFFWSLRKKMDIRFYSLMAKNQSQWIEFLTQVSDIKNYRFSDKKRWIWESNQVKLYKTRIKLLHIDQIQNLGSSIINSFKDAILIYLSASSVIKGDMTLGMMTAVQYILGQLTSPLDSIVNFIVSLQLCTISHGRITDIQKIKAEEELGVLENNISLADYSSNLKLNNV